MINPWMKKNPLLSLWLSGANRVVGTARAQASAAARRQGTAAVEQATQDWIAMWTAWPAAKAPRKRRR